MQNSNNNASKVGRSGRGGGKGRGGGRRGGGRGGRSGRGSGRGRGGGRGGRGRGGVVTGTGNSAGLTNPKESKQGQQEQISATANTNTNTNRNNDNNNNYRNQEKNYFPPPTVVGESNSNQQVTTAANKSNKGKAKKDKNTNNTSNNDKKLKNSNDHTKRNNNNNNNNNKGNNNNNNNKGNKQHKKSDKNKSNDKDDTKQESNKNNNKGKNSNNTNHTKTPTITTIPPNQPQTTNDINYKKGSPITVLHIAEKPSIAQAIAKGLCKGSSFNNTSHTKLPVYEFTVPSSTQPFPKAPYASKCTHKVSSVAGHVFSVDFPSSYQSWDTVDPAELFNAPIQKKPCQGSVVKHLQSCSKNVDFIVLWLDCDREGENIAFEVLDCCMDLMNNSSHSSTTNGKNGSSMNNSNYNRVYRAYFSAINPSDIQKAYGSLGKPDKNQSLAVDARQELDLKVGVSFSRFQTRYFQGRYGDLDSAVLSYGPCQTPTLGFCVKRHIDIETFTPQPYWLLSLGILKRGRIIKAQWDSGRSFNQNKVQKLIDTCCMSSSYSTAKVTSVVSKDKKQGRLTPLNTVALLKACSKALGIGPHQTMQVAESLYLSGYLSYPRTESTAYPKSFDIRDALNEQTRDSRWGNYVTDLLRSGPTKSRGGVDMGDHPPITPMRSADTHELSGNMSRVYELVTRHFIASVSPDAVFQSTKVSIQIEALKEKGNFTIRGKQLISPGFLAILLHKEYGDEPQDDNDDDEYIIEDDDTEEVQNLPEFIVGEEFILTSKNASSSSTRSKVEVVVSGSRATLELKEKMTTPPSYLTESELINLMEKNGIGTDASISTHIENIQKRNYVELITGRKMKPSKLGLVLAQGYHLIDSSLVLPQVRSDIESQCNKIAKGLTDKDIVIKHAISIFEEKFKYFVENVNKMDILFSSSFSKLEEVGKAFTRCGITRRYLQYIPGPPPRLYNVTTETVYPLPLGGVVKEFNSRKCPVCNFELCLYSVGQPPRSFPLCPYCFNHPKAEWGEIPGEEDNKKLSSSDDPDDREDELKERKIRSIAGRTMTLQCPHPDGHPLIAALTVGQDPEGNGVFTLDAKFGPKWRLCGTREPTIIHMPKGVDKVTVLDRCDEETKSHFIKLEFKDGSSSSFLDNGETSYVTCFDKDEKLQGSTHTFYGKERTQMKGGRGRGGRGRGGGGRGGHGGRKGRRGGRF